MELFIIMTVVIIVAVVAFLFFKFRNKIDTAEKSSENLSVISNTQNVLASDGSDEMTVKFEKLSVLTEEEETRLVEVKDKKLLTKIDSVVPGTLQAVVNAGVVKEYSETVKKTGQLYQAIIPNGAVLDKSRAMEGAVRGSFRDVPNSIKGQANWMPVDNNAGNNLAKLNVANAAMGVASMVVGQYYMTQINDQLEDITAGIEKIADFQEKEFKSKVYALIVEVQKSSTFQVETVENDELRNRELSYLKSLEHECTQLLGQANLSLREITGKQDLDYDEYEKLIGEAETWYQYQQILLEVMYKISDLSYALNLGAISRENSYALYLPYAKQSEGALVKLINWHKSNGDKFQISMIKNRRKRQGMEGFFMRALGVFNDDFNYKKMAGRTVALIENQTDGKVFTVPTANDDLFQEDVRLVAKEGKLYYLPIANGE